MVRWLTIAALLVQAVIGTFMVIDAMEPLRTGTEYTVTVTGVDPRDLMMGQYVQLDYPFSTINLAHVDRQIHDNTNLRFGQVVYVTLSGTSDPQAVRVSLTKPESGAFIKGSVALPTPVSSQYSLFLEYGIESYYADPETAEQLDKQLSQGDSLRVHLRIDSDGDARIERLEVKP